MVSHSNFTLEIVKNATSKLETKEALEECVNTIEGVIMNIHDDQKRILALQMVEGPINSALNMKDEGKSLHRILLIIIRCFGSVSEPQLFDTVSSLLNKVFSKNSLVGSKEILTACKG